MYASSRREMQFECIVAALQYRRVNERFCLKKLKNPLFPMFLHGFRWQNCTCSCQEASEAQRDACALSLACSKLGNEAEDPSLREKKSGTVSVSQIVCMQLLSRSIYLPCQPSFCEGSCWTNRSHRLAQLSVCAIRVFELEAFD